MSTLYQDLEEAGLHYGRKISAYKQAPEGHKAFFNACIFDQGFIQCWHGDIDFDVSGPILQKIATNRQVPFYVTKETPFRWEGLNKKTVKKLVKDDDDQLVIIEP